MCSLQILPRICRRAAHPAAATGDVSGCSNSITPFGLKAVSQVSSPFLLNPVRDQSFKKQKYFWCLPLFFKIFVIKMLTDGFGDTSFLIRILRHIFKSLLITQQSCREEAGFGMSSCFFFFPQKIIQDSPKREKKEIHFCLQLARALCWGYRNLAAGFHISFFGQ